MKLIYILIFFLTLLNSKIFSCNINEVHWNTINEANEWELGGINEIEYLPVELKPDEDEAILWSELGPVKMHSQGDTPYLLESGADSVGHFHRLGAVLAGLNYRDSAYDKIFNFRSSNNGEETELTAEAVSRLAENLLFPCGQIPEGFTSPFPNLVNAGNEEKENALRKIGTLFQQLDQAEVDSFFQQFSQGYELAMERIKLENLEWAFSRLKSSICKANKLSGKDCDSVSLRALVPKSNVNYGISERRKKWYGSISSGKFLRAYTVILAPGNLTQDSVVFAWFVKGDLSYENPESIAFALSDDGYQQVASNYTAGDLFSSKILGPLNKSEQKALKKLPAFKSFLKKERDFLKKNKGINFFYPYISRDSSKPTVTIPLKYVSYNNGKIEFIAQVNDLRSMSKFKSRFKYMSKEEEVNLTLRLASKMKSCRRFDTQDSECEMNKINGFEQPGYCRRYANCERENSIKTLRAMLPYAKKDAAKKKRAYQALAKESKKGRFYVGNQQFTATSRVLLYSMMLNAGNMRSLSFKTSQDLRGHREQIKQLKQMLPYMNETQKKEANVWFQLMNNIEKGEGWTTRFMISASADEATILENAGSCFTAAFYGSPRKWLDESSTEVNIETADCPGSY